MGREPETFAEATDRLRQTFKELGEVIVDEFRLRELARKIPNGWMVFGVILVSAYLIAAVFMTAWELSK